LILSLYFFHFELQYQVGLDQQGGEKTTMKILSILLILCAVLVVRADDFAPFVSFAELESRGNCFPDCGWNCDTPTCPAICEPQCEKPQCELRCEKLPETQCDIRCEKPKCEVRCSRNNCQSGGCPICENVCLPARCQTVCTPGTPVCKPVCSAPKCTWLCHKPNNCPKPKCNLQCNNRPSPASTGCSQSQGQSCCSCQSVSSMQSAMEIASAVHNHNTGSHPDPELLPSMVEVAHEIRMKSSLGEAEQCCPCGGGGV